MVSEAKFWAKINKNGSIIRGELGPCWEWTAYCQPEPKPYGRAYYNSKLWMAHRLAWFFVNGEIPDGIKVCHKCDNYRCCNPNHLFLGSDKDNIDDCEQKSRRKFIGNARKLTFAEVDQIKTLFHNGVSAIALAAQYDVHKTTIWNVLSGTTYATQEGKGIDW